MALYFITGNKKKFREVKDILGDVKHLDVDLPEIQEIDQRKIIEAKLNEALKHRKGEFIVEDTGFYMDCLNGLPGPLGKWFLKTAGLQKISDISYKFKNYNAYFKSIVGYAHNGKIEFFEGICKGSVVSPKGNKGFGFDPVFIPYGFKNTLAEMSIEEKNKISHRRKALDKLKEFLER